MSPVSRWPIPILACAFAACSNGGQAAPTEPARLVLAANAVVVEPVPEPIPPLDYARFGITIFDGVYRVTTPANEPFAFNLVAWNEGAAGWAAVSIAHVGDGGASPLGGIPSLAAAGIAPAGMGLWTGSNWLTAQGDGFARLTVQGIIAREQVLAVNRWGGPTAIVVIAIGERSEINHVERTPPANPSVASRATIYSSDAWIFGLPTIAVSGDRTTIVTYEGDRRIGMMGDRYELRMQHDRISGAVTGGGTVETSSDSGNWRDHEIAALYNVLAVSRSERDLVRIKLSYDRGATFGQEVLLAQHQASAIYHQTRLVQTAMALDYTLAVCFWQLSPSGDGLDLLLCEGRPTAFDLNGSPTWYGFDPPQVVHTMPVGCTPLLTGMTWSAGGDLAIGYGATTVERTGRTWRSTTEFGCAVRRWGEGLVDHLVDREQIFGYDPSVAVLGQGASLRIFYAYETRDGVRLATSDDGGATFAIAPPFGGAGAHNPTVFARQVGADTRVDVLYLANNHLGCELHQARWQAFGTSARDDYRLTAAAMTPTPYQTGRPTPWGYTGPFDHGWRTTQVSWLGYDAVLDGNQIVAVVDEVTQDAAYVCTVMFPEPNPNGGLITIFGSPGGGFHAATPPPLAPGMTEPMPPVDPAHSHQLQLIRID